MGLKLHRRAETYAKGRINRGKIDYDGEWSLSDEERNALFVEGAERFGEWHLGRDEEGDVDRLSTYSFCYGKDGQVSRAALDAIVKEAGRKKKKEPACADIAQAAKELRDMIDRKKANSRKLLFFGERPGMQNESDPRKRFEGVIMLDTTIVLGDYPDMVDGGGARGWTQICKTGKFLGHWQGPFEVTDDDLAAMVENFNRLVNPVMFDYGHESVWNSAADASGWGHEFEIGKSGDALYCDTEWTRNAADKIREGEQKYISPVIMFSTIDPYTAEDLGPSIWTVALLNTPFLDGMDPVAIGGQIAAQRKQLNGAPPRRQWAIPASSQQAVVDIAKKVGILDQKALGDLPVPPPEPDEDTGTNSSPAPAGTDITPPPEPAPATPDPEPEVVPNTSTPTEDDTMSLKSIALSLDLPEDATAEQINSAIAAQKQAAETAEAKATEAKALADQKAQEAEALEAEKKERELQSAKDAVESYIKAGRIAPNSRDKAVELYLQDHDTFEQLYGKPDEPGKPAVPLGQVATAPEAPQAAGGAPGLTPEEVAFCQKMQLEPGRFALEKQRRRDKGLLNGRADLPDEPDNITIE